MTSGFGWRWGRMHEGIDIGVPEGTPVHAAAAGTVIYAGWMSGYGNIVVIDHGNGLATAYAHNSQLIVGQGATVGQGLLIALSGSTGPLDRPARALRGAGQRRAGGPARVSVGRRYPDVRLKPDASLRGVGGGRRQRLGGHECRSGSARQRSSSPRP